MRGLGDTWRLAVAATCLKLLLMPAYKSTDFEVHRNWMAVTSSLPPSKWYTEATSKWTLDYPPLFAAFEYVLSLFAPLFDPKMLQVSEAGYTSPGTVLYQRLTVVLSEAVLVTGVARFCANFTPVRRGTVAFLVFFSPALIVVDHLHFQYNGMLLGLLVWSLAMAQEGKDVVATILFSSLLCAKHLFAYGAPIMALFFIHRCFVDDDRPDVSTMSHNERLIHMLERDKAVPFNARRFSTIAAAALAVFAIAFGPFVFFGQRMFPFGRGLLHAYWAPNVWALYAFADKVLATVFRVDKPVASLTGGLVGADYNFAILPQMHPVVTFVLVLVALFPCVAAIALWRFPTPSTLVRSVAWAYLCGFMLGWHVHEKAVLMFLIPMALYAADSRQAAREFIFTSVVAHYQLFPLLYGAQEYPIKLALVVAYTLGSLQAFRQLGYMPPRQSTSADGKTAIKSFAHLLSLPERLFLIGLVALEAFNRVGHPLLVAHGALQGLPFLPLMLTSVACAAGLCAAWWQVSQYWKLH
eukprot:jgi/Chlat1/2260/Chrsp17S02789